MNIVVQGLIMMSYNINSAWIGRGYYIPYFKISDRNDVEPDGLTVPGHSFHGVL